MKKYKYFVIEKNIVVNCILATEEFINSIEGEQEFVRCDEAGPELKYNPQYEQDDNG
jgi:hypothetical protein